MSITKDSQKVTQTVKYPWYVGHVALNAVSKAKGVPFSGPTSVVEGADRASATVESSDVVRISVVWEKNIAPFEAWRNERTNLESILGKAQRNAKYQSEHFARVNVTRRTPDGNTVTADPRLKKDVEGYMNDADAKAKEAQKALDEHDKKKPVYESVQFHIELDAEVSFS